MSRFLSIIIAFMLICTLAACSQEAESVPPSPEPATQQSQTEPEPEPEPQQPDAPEITLDPQTIIAAIYSPSIENNMVDESAEQEIGIFLPANYKTSGKSYPVLYFLPEGTAAASAKNYKMYLNDFAEGMGDSEDMIIVVINGVNRLGSSFYVNSPVTGNWEDYVVKEVIPYIDGNYRTIADSSGRGIAGHSMGGFGAINIVMRNAGLFDHVFSINPEMFGENGLSNSLMDMSLIQQSIEKYEGLSDEEAKEEYLYSIKMMNRHNIKFTFAYGSAFAYDANTKAPYIRLPGTDADGNYLQDDVWALYEGGYGNLAEKVTTYGDSLKSLENFKIEYIINSSYMWIAEGCEYFSGLLTENGIPHEFVLYDGNYHQGMDSDAIKEKVIPFFVEAFA